MNQQNLANDALWLVRLTELLGVSCDRSAAIRYLKAVQRELAPGGDGRERAFPLAGRRAGLRVVPLRETLAGAAEHATRETPLVAVAGRGSGEIGAVVIDRRAGKLLAQTAPQETPRWISERSLAEHLGVPDADASLDWWLVQGASPCAAAETRTQGADAGSPPTPLARLFGILRPDRSDLWAILVFAVASGALLLATPIAVQALVNFVAFGGAVAPVIVLAGLLALGLGFAAAIGALQAWIVEVLQRRIFVRMVADLSHRLPRVHRSIHDRSYGPELVNRFFDVITVQKISSLLLLDGVGVLLGVFIGLIVLAFYHPLLLVFDLLIVLAVAAIVFLLGRSGVRTAIKESKTKYAVASWLEEVSRSPVTFKSPEAREFALQRSDALARDYVFARRTHYRVLFRQILGMLGLQVAASVALLGIGGVLVIRGELTLGQLVASELIVTYVVGSIAKMGKHFESYYDLMAAVDKLGVLLDLELERPTGDAWSSRSSRDARGAAVQLRDVVLRIASARGGLDGFSFAIAPGERIGITGPSGSGKSRLIEMLYGLVDPEGGSLEIDGIDVRSLRLEDLRQRVKLVSRREVFEGTIRENILMGRSLPTEEVHAALRRTGLFDGFAALPDGIDTRLTSTGLPLSEGQIQRLMLTRKIVGAPGLLLVDTSLDGLSRDVLEQVLDVITDQSAPWTLIIASAREEVLRRCDRVIDIAPGAEPLGSRAT